MEIDISAGAAWVLIDGLQPKIINMSNNIAVLLYKFAEL